MTTQLPDRRVQRTRKLLQDALVALILEQGYAAVTVQAIIDRANIGRSTFYAHFQDTESLLLSTFEWLWEDFERYFATQPNTAERPPWELTLRLFQHVHQQQRFYKALLSEKAGVAAMGKVNQTLTLRIGAHLGAFAPHAPPLMRELVAHFSIHGLIALLTWWLDNDLPFSPAEMNEILQKLLHPGVENMLQPRWKSS